MNNLTLSELCFIVLEASWQPPNCANKTVLYFSRILSYAGHSKRKCTSSSTTVQEHFEHTRCCLGSLGRAHLPVSIARWCAPVRNPRVHQYVKPTPPHTPNKLVGVMLGCCMARRAVQWSLLIKLKAANTLLLRSHLISLNKQTNKNLRCGCTKAARSC